MAVDFVSPEAMCQTLGMTEQLEQCPRNTDASPHESIYQDKLQVGVMIDEGWGGGRGASCLDSCSVQSIMPPSSCSSLEYRKSSFTPVTRPRSQLLSCLILTCSPPSPQGRLILMSSAVECYLQLHAELASTVPSRADPMKRLEDQRRGVLQQYTEVPVAGEDLQLLAPVEAERSPPSKKKKKGKQPKQLQQRSKRASVAVDDDDDGGGLMGPKKKPRVRRVTRDSEDGATLPGVGAGAGAGARGGPDDVQAEGEGGDEDDDGEAGSPAGDAQEGEAHDTPAAGGSAQKVTELPGMLTQPVGMELDDVPPALGTVIVPTEPGPLGPDPPAGCLAASAPGELLSLLGVKPEEAVVDPSAAAEEAVAGPSRGPSAEVSPDGSRRSSAAGAVVDPPGGNHKQQQALLGVCGGLGFSSKQQQQSAPPVVPRAGRKQKSVQRSAFQ